MSDRDEFAKAAMQGLFSAAIASDYEDKKPFLFWGEKDIMFNHPDVPKMVARLAYEVADAMVARMKPQAGPRINP